MRRGREEWVLGDAGSGDLYPVRRRGGKVDRRSVGEDDKGEEERGIGHRTKDGSRRTGKGKRRRK